MYIYRHKNSFLYAVWMFKYWWYKPCNYILHLVTNNVPGKFQSTKTTLRVSFKGRSLVKRKVSKEKCNKLGREGGQKVHQDGSLPLWKVQQSTWSSSKTDCNLWSLIWKKKNNKNLALPPPKNIPPKTSVELSLLSTSDECLVHFGEDSNRGIHS